MQQSTTQWRVGFTYQARARRTLDPLRVSPSAAVTLHCPSVAASALRPGSSHQLPNIAQHRLRFKRLIVKARTRRDIVGQGLSRDYDDADLWPSLGNVLCKVRSAHRTRHIHVREQHVDFVMFAKKMRRIVGGFGRKNAVSCVLKHIRFYFPQQRFIFNNQNCVVG